MFLEMLKKNEDKIMKYTLGSITDESGVKYVDIYKDEWNEHLISINEVFNVLKSADILMPKGMAYIILSDWFMAIDCDITNLDIDKLTEIIEDILVDLDLDYMIM